MRIGVLSGGGDCPGLNAVIRSAAKTAINVYGWQVIGIEDGYEGLILPDKARPLSLADVRGILQRGGSPSAFDRLLARRFGAFAVRLMVEEQYDQMVALRGESLVAVPLAEATGRQKCVPLDGDVVVAARGLGICLGG
jgi:6-phosphofructokinase